MDEDDRPIGVADASVAQAVDDEVERRVRVRQQRREQVRRQREEIVTVGEQHDDVGRPAEQVSCEDREHHLRLLQRFDDGLVRRLVEARADARFREAYASEDPRVEDGDRGQR